MLHIYIYIYIYIYDISSLRVNTGSKKSVFAFAPFEVRTVYYKLVVLGLHGPWRWAETSVTTYHPTPCNVPEEGESQILFHLQDVGVGVVSFLMGARPSGRIFTRRLQ